MSDLKRTNVDFTRAGHHKAEIRENRRLKSELPTIYPGLLKGKLHLIDSVVHLEIEMCA